MTNTMRVKSDAGNPYSRKALWLFSAVLALSAAQADTWHQNKTTGISKTSATYLKAMSDASYWTSVEGGTNGEEMVTTDTYVVSEGYSLSCDSSSPFKGGSLVIGDLASPNYSTRLYFNGNVTIPNGTLTFACGYAQHGTASGSNYNIPDVYVTASASAPFGVLNTGNSCKGITIAKLIGESGTGIVLGGRYTGNGAYTRDSHTDETYKLSDISQYHGNITIMSERSHLSRNTGNVRVTIAMSDTFGGSLEAEDGVDILAVDAQELAVSNLTLHAGSSYRVGYDTDSKTASVIRVSHKFSIPEDEGKVYIRFSSNPEASEKVRTYPLIVVPDSEELDEGRFSVNETLDPEYLPRLSVVHDETTHTKTLVATFCAKLRLVTADKTGYESDGANYTSALSEGHESQWSDGKLPHELAVYEMGQETGYGNCLRTCEFKSTADYVFKGELLRTMGDQAFFVFAGHHAFEANIEVTAMTYFRVYNGFDPTLRGTLALNANVQSQTYNGSVLTVKSAISGAGNWTIPGRNGTSSPQGTVAFEGDNSEWKGAISMTQKSGTGKNGRAYPCYETYHQNLLFSDEKNLGGPLDEFNYKALSLNHYSAVLVTNSLALSKDMNRGIYVTNAAIFNVSADCTFDCGWPVTFAGTLYKSGAGTVGFDGVKFRDAAGALTDEIPEKPEHRLLVVTNGCVKALSHDCLDGITIDLRKPTSTVSTSLAVAFNPADADLKRYGFYNVKTTTPFAEGHVINFKILNVDAAALEAARAMDAGYKQGLVTVKTTVAKNVEDNLAVEKVKGLRLIREDDAETETTTFSLYGKKLGLAIIVR